MEQYGRQIESKPHYAYVTRSAIELFNKGRLTNVDNIDVEPGYGYVTRLTYNNGSHRITYGNDLGLNTGASSSLASDKGHTKFMLRTIGVETPQGREFLLPWWADEIGNRQKAKGNTDIKTIDDAQTYLDEELGYPAYIKSVSGSKGTGVERANDWSDAKAAFQAFDEAHVRVAVVEEAVAMPDYRLVVLDGELISSYQRVPLSVRGDGERDIASLIEQTQAAYEAQGRDTLLDSNDPKILRHLGARGLTLTSVPAFGETVSLLAISNLSAGGTSVDVTHSTNERWQNLAAYIAGNMNLRICGVDLACADITASDAAYSVLEVNAAPGLDHYASSGDAQKAVVEDLYAKVLNAYPTV